MERIRGTVPVTAPEDSGEAVQTTRPHIGLRFARLQRQSRLWMALVLLLSDSLALFAAGLAAVGLRYILGNLVNPPFYWSMLPFILLFLASYALSGLYPAVGLGPVEELRRLSKATSLVFIFINAFTFWVRSAENYSRLIFAFAWILALLSVPLVRWLARRSAIHMGWWGEPVAILGGGAAAIQTAEFLERRPQFGLKPALFVTEVNQTQPTGFKLPSYTFRDRDRLRMRLDSLGVRTAILANDDLEPELNEAVLNRQEFRFARLILIHDLSWIGSMGVTPYDLEGLLGLELRQNLLNPWHQHLKRFLDLSLGLSLGVLSIPLIALIGLLVRLDSPGSAFYRHARLGKDGRHLWIWKFRTMRTDGERVLNSHLECDPLAQREWLESQKLKCDPRITRLGHILRRTSLDEIPQIWNVVRGEMSLVGPRPIVEREVELYAKGYALYQRVLPGITGLWQVSGRNDLDYDERVRLDEYYVRNWSIWLDVYILARTFGAVISRKGAY